MKRPLRTGAVVVILVVIALTAFLATRHLAPQADAIESPLVGHRAPAVVATTLNGAHFSLRAERGRVVVLTFWASWCGPCQQEAPDLSTFAYRERNAKVTLIGVVFQDELSDARAFQTHYGSLYPSLEDPNGAIANAYGVTSPPTTFIIGPNGMIREELVGAATAGQLQTIVRRLET